MTGVQTCALPICGTKATPFAEPLKKDYEEIRIGINDTSKSDNSGEVTFKVSIR